jgi:hypothetical protein
VQPETDGLAADLDPVQFEHQEGDGLTAPAAAEEAEVAWRRGGDPADDDGGPSGGEAKGPAGLVPDEALHPLLAEPLDPTVDRP